jgi:thymidylate kinase
MKTRLSVVNATIDQIAGGHHEENGHKPDVPALLAFWKKNKYPLLALNHGSESPELLGTPEFQAALKEENVIYNSLKTEYSIVRERWARAGIRSLLIKSGGVFPSFPYTSDNLDVLIRKEDEAAAKAILCEEGYIELKNIEEPQKFLFRKFSEGVSVSAIHLHTQVGWIVGFMDEKALWERSQAAPDDAATTVPSPEDVILITIAHSFYENKRFRFADVVKIREWWSRGTIDWEYMEKVAAQRGWLDGLHFCSLLCAHIEEATWGETAVPLAIRESCLAALKRLPLIYRYYQKIIRRSPVSLPLFTSFLFSKYLYYKKILRDRNNSLIERLGEVFQTLLIGVKVRTRIRPQPSFLVSFSGADGSGKTLHAETLVGTLDTCEVNAKYYWNRTATSWLIRLFSGIIKIFKRQTSKTEGQKPGAAGRLERLRNPLLRFFWSYLAATDMVFSYLLRVRLPMLFGNVVVCDRYVFDAAAEMECSLLPKDRLNRLAIKMMLALSPKPDVAYLFDIPGEVCAQRKSDNTDAVYLLQQRKAYLELAVRYNLKIKKTDREFREIADELTREVLPSYYHDYGTFLRSLFLSNPNQLNKYRKGEQG